MFLFFLKLDNSSRSLLVLLDTILLVFNLRLILLISLNTYIIFIYLKL